MSLVKTTFGIQEGVEASAAACENNETARIKERYQRRGQSSRKELYSYFNQGNLFMVQTRQRKLLALLKENGFEKLQDKRILEIGCGTGAWLRDFVQWGARPSNLYGIDLLADRIRTAQELNPNIHYTVANAERLDFADSQFDIVLMATCLTSVLDSSMKKRMVAESLRVLRGEGIILCYDFRYDNPNNPDVRGIGKREIRSLFGPCRYEFKRVTLAPPIVRRLARVSWLACELLDKLSFLDTHYFILIRKPV